MEIEKIEDKKIWEDFLLDCSEKTFLQSWNWGEFQERMGNKIWRFGIYDGGQLVNVALVIKISAKRGTFLLIQHLVKTDRENLEILLEKLKEIGKKEGVAFIRLAPLWLQNAENQKIFKDLGFIKSPMHANAYEATWKLDLAPSEEELLMGIRKTTRYLIRQAQKDKNIAIFQRWDISDTEVFNKIHQEVVKTQKFTPFSFEYFKNEFLTFRQDDQIRLFFGKYKDEVVASAFVLFWSNIGFYHHAALLPQYHKIPISYLLQWEAIKEAKKRGCKFYDFWGFTDPQKYPKHPWAGPTLFKMGFGGKSYKYVKTQDYLLSKKYWLTYLFEKLRKIKRGL